MAALRRLPACRSHACSAPDTLRRPLLAVPRIEIAAWANARGLKWIDDDSNVDARFDRNFIRHEVLPVLQAKWPDAASRLQHAARRFADEAVLVREALDRRLEEFGVDGTRIAVAVAADPQALPLLRRWLESNGVTGVRERVLMEIVRQAGGALDRLPQVGVAAARTVRRFADHLYLVSQAKTRFETGNWKLGEPLTTPAGLLCAERGSGVRTTLA